jgi:hypothetical protein
VDLDTLNFTPEKLLAALRRATRANYRYIYTCGEQGRSVDPIIANQLTNHMMLLRDVARAAGIDPEDVVDAMRLGSQQAFDEQ